MSSAPQTAALYRDIFSEAFKLCLRNKFLWFFGFFAAFLGSGGIYEIVIKNIFSLNIDRYFFLFQRFNFLGGDRTFAEYSNFILSFLFLGIFIFLIFGLAVISLAAIICAVNESKSKTAISFRQCFFCGWKRFWPVFSINVLAKISIYLLIFVIFIFLLNILSQSTFINSILYLSFFIILTAFSFFIYFLAIFASIFSTIEKSSFTHSLRKAWQIFAANWLAVIEITLAIFLIYTFAGLALMFFLFLLAIPLFAFLFLIYFFSLKLNPIYIFLSLFWIFIFLTILLSSFLSAFQISSWALFALRLREGAFISKLVRIFKRQSL